MDIRHTKDKRAVDVTYVRHDKAVRVRGKHVIYAGYNGMLPKFCPEVPALQREALTYPVQKHAGVCVKPAEINDRAQ